MGYRLIILTCLGLIGLHFPQAFAAPAITGVSGTFQDGQTVTISGSEFGATGPNVAFFDTFEKGTVGSPVSTAINSADIGNWATQSTNGGTVSTISSGYALSGGKSLQVDWRPQDGWGSGPSMYYPNVQNSYLLFSWWQFLPANRDVPGTNSVDGANWKWFWIGDRNDGWPMGSDYAGQQHYGFNADGTTVGIQGAVLGHDEGLPARYDCGWYTKDPLFQKGTWMRVTMVMKNAASGGYIWQQEVSSAGQEIQFNVSNVVTAHADDPWNILILPGFGREDNNAVAYYDDVYVATGDGARARVEIGNAPTYSACTNLSIITPTSWGDTSIQATVRSGSFASGSAYLYVVDASGVANSAGYSITLSESGGDTTPPSTTISTSDPSSISSDSLTVTGSSSDAVGVSGCKWRVGSAPDSGNGTACTGTTSFSCSTSGYSSGSNIIYVGCYDAAGNYGSDSITVNYSPSTSTIFRTAGGVQYRKADGTLFEVGQ